MGINTMRLQCHQSASRKLESRITTDRLTRLLSHDSFSQQVPFMWASVKTLLLGYNEYSLLALQLPRSDLEAVSLLFRSVFHRLPSSF